MTKKINAYFNSAETARAAAFDLSENSISSDIMLSTVNSDQAEISNCSFTWMIIGAVLGTILGLLVFFIPNVGLVSNIAPVTGLISGSVIGAITGALFDIATYEQSPLCTQLSVCTDKENAGFISKMLKRRGAVLVSSVR